MRAKLLPVALAAAGAVLAVNGDARRRVASSARAALDALRRRLGQRGDSGDTGVATYRSVPAGDVDSEDPAGSWADDGGGGRGGGQASPVSGSAPLPPEH